MKKLAKLLLISLTILLAFGQKASAQQSDGYDVFVPISKYIAKGDVESLSAWFADNLEITILSSSNNSSKNQAKQILKSFFESHTPRSFEITHKVSKSTTKYAMGSLNAGGEVYSVSVFVNYNGKSYKIQQLKIERIQQ